MSIQAVGIAGLGLIGGSMAAALRSAGAHVRGLDLRPDHAAIARQRGLIDEQAESVNRLCDGADVVILAMPVFAIVEALPHVDAVAPARAVILDTGSVKRPIVQAMAQTEGARRAVGGHPIAGRQTAGPRAADPELFLGRPFVLTRTARTEDRAAQTAQDVVELIGASPVFMSAEHHDEVLARTSHLPQILASALALTAERSDLPFAGSGFADMTRLAESDPDVWRDIFLSNRDNVMPAIDRYIDHLHELREAVGSANDEALCRLMQSGKDRIQVAPVGKSV